MTTRTTEEIEELAIQWAWRNVADGDITSAVNGYCIGYRAGVEAERERAKGLVEALEVCKIYFTSRLLPSHIATVDKIKELSDMAQVIVLGALKKYRGDK